MMRRYFLIFLLPLLVVFIPSVHAETLNIDLAQNHVDITTGFSGAHLVLYGVKEAEGEIAVVITGPSRDMIVRRKDTIMGAWMNKSSMRFRNVPLYYDYALSASESELASQFLLAGMGIGVNGLHFNPDRRGESQRHVQDFQEALVRNKQAQRLFPVKPRKITFIDENFFKVRFDLPANVPTGDYKVKTFLFNKGKLIYEKQTDLHVGQVGLGARIYKFAHLNAFLYGVFCIILAISAGFAVNVIGRRER